MQPSTPAAIPGPDPKSSEDPKAAARRRVAFYCGGVGAAWFVLLLVRPDMALLSVYVLLCAMHAGLTLAK